MLGRAADVTAEAGLAGMWAPKVFLLLRDILRTENKYNRNLRRAKGGQGTEISRRLTCIFLGRSWGLHVLDSNFLFGAEAYAV